ncbi:MAG: serine/threonine-protein kinase [Phycisphaerae bacterium]
MSSVQTLEVPGFQVVQFLGSGACSTIWRVRESRTDKHFALKRVIRRHSGDFRFLEQAQNEYDVGHRLDHPVLRHIHSIRRVKRWLRLHEIHVIMEFCDGRTVQDERPRTVADALRIFEQVAAGLSYMNAQGFVHADTKPNNIVVSPAGAVKLIDFGQSCPLGTIKQRIQGTPDFIAPEQVHRRPLDARTDVFNFGAALYWTLARRPIPTILPKGNSTLMADLAVQPLEQVNFEVPPALSKLVADCIELHPTRRPVSMNEVASRLGLIAHKIQRDAMNGGSPPPAPSADDTAKFDAIEILEGEDKPVKNGGRNGNGTGH